MFSIPGTPLVRITPAAAKQINSLIARSNKHALRIGLKKGGCAGMEYSMEFLWIIPSNIQCAACDAATMPICSWASWAVRIVVKTKAALSEQVCTGIF